MRSPSSPTNLPDLRRCHHCGAWQHDGYEACVYCGGDLTLGRVERVLRAAPLTATATAAAAVGAVAVFVVDAPAALRLGAVTVLASAVTSAVVVLPRNALSSTSGRRHRPAVCFDEVEQAVKSAFKRAKAAHDPAEVTIRLALLLRELKLLRHGNRAAPILYGRQLARDHRRSQTETLKSTIKRLNELDHSWVSKPLGTTEADRHHIVGLTALLKAVKARPRTWLERLTALDLGAPLPFIDIEAQLTAIAAEAEELDGRTSAMLPTAREPTNS